MQFGVGDTISISGASCAVCSERIAARSDREYNAVMLNGGAGFRALVHPECLGPEADAIDLPEEKAFTVGQVAGRSTFIGPTGHAPTRPLASPAGDGTSATRVAAQASRSDLVR